MQETKAEEVTWAKPVAGMVSHSGAKAHLLHLDTMVLQQKKDMYAVLTGLLLPNSYSLKTPNGEQVFYLEEKSHGFESGPLCQPQRGFIVAAMDSAGHEVVRFVRRDKACKGILPCCACAAPCREDIAVESPPGEVVGRVSQLCSLGGRCNEIDIRLLDSGGSEVFRVENVSLVYCCKNGQTLEFPVKSLSGGESDEPVARISRQFRPSGLNRMLAGEADSFTISMPMDLHLDMKLTLIGVCLLLDFSLFDNAPPQSSAPTSVAAHSK